jgi:ATP-dependent RNA helicase DeaD
VSVAAFGETGLEAPLAEAMAAAGCDEPNALQRETIPVVRRGGNVVLRASPGSGAMIAWAAGLLERVPAFEGDTHPHILVITPTEERAIGIVESLARVTAAVPEAGASIRALRIRAAAWGWITRSADLLAVNAAAAAAEIEASRLKLDGVHALIVDGVAQILTLDGAAALETVLLSIPREAQRVFVTAEVTRDIDGLVERHGRRAIHIPARRSEIDARTDTSRRIGYLVTREAAKLDVLMAQLAGRDAAEDVIATRSRERAAWLRAGLSRRGLEPDAGGPEVRAFVDGGLATIAWDVPFDAPGLAAITGSAPLVMITPAERSHLESIARHAGIVLETAARAARARDTVTAYRRQISRAIEEEDIDAQFALLAPLFERHAPEEVAAALSALHRRSSPPAEAPRPARPSAPAFVRLFISAGQRDGLRPADLVGAIAGETGLSGDRIGRIDIRESFSVAEVEAAEAEKVIRALNGTTLRGRSVRVDYDRRSTPGAIRRSRPPRPGP